LPRILQRSALVAAPPHGAQFAQLAMLKLRGAAQLAYRRACSSKVAFLNTLGERQLLATTRAKPVRQFPY
jgi:hypothetical protein